MYGVTLLCSRHRAMLHSLLCLQYIRVCISLLIKSVSNLVCFIGLFASVRMSIYKFLKAPAETTKYDFLLNLWPQIMAINILVYLLCALLSMHN